MGEESDQISGIVNPFRLGEPGADTRPFSPLALERVQHLHRSLPGYSQTPLTRLGGLAKRLGLDEVWIKDESLRFGLNAFKSLGASYAISQLFLEGAAEPDFDKLRAGVIADPQSKPTFVSATDGNHGCAVAWMGQLLGVNSVIYMPSGSEQVRIDAIRAYGGHVEVIDGNYDDAVSHASAQAKSHGWELIQDMAWEGYTSVPLWIMQGYSTLFSEIITQIEGQTPTHVFLQAGVGSMAGAFQAALVEHYGPQCPSVSVVEPDNAACYFKSMQSGDGQLHALEGHLDTSMAGLACGTPSSLAWPIIRYYSEYFFKCPDRVTELGMQVLAHPLNDDERVISGESGAVTTGLLVELMENTNLKEMAERMSLGPDSKILLISTEGDTDPDNYQRVTSR